MICPDFSWIHVIMCMNVCLNIVFIFPDESVSLCVWINVWNAQWFALIFWTRIIECIHRYLNIVLICPDQSVQEYMFEHGDDLPWFLLNPYSCVHDPICHTVVLHQAASCTYSSCITLLTVHARQCLSLLCILAFLLTTSSPMFVIDTCLCQSVSNITFVCTSSFHILVLRQQTLHSHWWPE